MPICRRVQKRQNVTNALFEIYHNLIVEFNVLESGENILNLGMERHIC